MKKIVILGSKGMLGSELVKTFSEDSRCIVLGLDKEEIDITSKEEVTLLFEKENPEVVINAVAYNAVDQAEESEDEFEKAKKLNAEVPRFLAEKCKKNDAIFVQYLTDYLFDGEKGVYDESDKPSPISNYGISKAMGEENVQEFGEKFYLIRTSKLFGNPGESELSKQSFFEKMMEIAKDKEEIKAIDSGKSCFTYVPDLAKATKKLVDESFAYGIYHLVNEGAVTWFEGIKKLFNLKPKKNLEIIPVTEEEFPRSAKVPKSSILLNTKFPKLRHYEEALKEWLETKKP